MKSILLLLVLLAVAISSCEKKDVKPEKPQTTKEEAKRLIDAKKIMD